jgi:phenol 2-monooxygenase
LIPREGDSLVRCYIELPAGTVAKSVQLEDLHRAAQNIFYPYSLEIAETFWWSAYSIGQRLVESFHRDHRVFLTGDACHTHSPKAGQGMNVSLQDGYNIGWKLAAILKGRANPSLLETYTLERQKVAADLIDFDRRFTKLFSSQAGSDHPPEYFAEQFIKAGRYTAGLTAKYDDSTITSATRSKQELATGLTVGMRFPSAQVVRFCDAKALQLIKAFPSDGRWRIVVFAGDIIENAACAERLDKVRILAPFSFLNMSRQTYYVQLAKFLSSEEGPIRRFTAPEEDADSFIEPLLVLHGARVRVEQEQIPSCFCPVNGKWRMRGISDV